MDQQQKVAELIVRFGKKDPMRATELKALHEHLRGLPENELSDILERLMQEGPQTEDLPDGSNLDKARIYEAIINDPRYCDTQTKKNNGIRKLKAGQHFLRWAAVFVILMSLGLFAYQLRQREGRAIEAATALALQAASPRAIMSFADGTSIELAKGQSEIVLRQGHIYYKDGTLAINRAFHDSERLSLSTPKGGVYSATLADGTHIKLSAGSSLDFPVAFSKELRKVNLVGEAYFDVEKGTAGRWPFEVHSPREIARVLGTTFNINAYPGEQEQTTTLYTGKLAVEDKQHHALTLLKPQQQVVNRQHAGLKTVAVTNPSESDWTQGMFVFHEKKLAEIAPQLARWYNVDIHFEGGSENEVFDGTIPRSNDLHDILQLMEMTGTVHSRAEGRKVIISRTR